MVGIIRRKYLKWKPYLRSIEKKKNPVPPKLPQIFDPTMILDSLNQTIETNDDSELTNVSSNMNHLLRLFRANWIFERRHFYVFMHR